MAHPSDYEFLPKLSLIDVRSMVREAKTKWEAEGELAPKGAPQGRPWWIDLSTHLALLELAEEALAARAAAGTTHAEQVAACESKAKYGGSLGVNPEPDTPMPLAVEATPPDEEDWA